MKRRQYAVGRVGAGLVALLVSVPAAAQVKISGTLVCRAPDPEHRLPVSDSPHHVFVISQSKCTWTKPISIAGALTTESSFTNFDELNGSGASEMSFGVGTLASGDTFYVRTRSTARFRPGGADVDGTWSFEGGTGKTKDVKGGGTHTCSTTAEGLVCEVAGDYTLPN